MNCLDLAPFRSGGVGGRILVAVRPDACATSRHAFFALGSLVVYSQTALVLGVIGGAVWHDWPDHCPTWTGPSTSGACCCDVEGAGR